MTSLLNILYYPLSAHYLTLLKSSQQFLKSIKYKLNRNKTLTHLKTTDKSIMCATHRNHLHTFNLIII